MPSVILPANADSYITSSAPDQNNGTSAQIVLQDPTAFGIAKFNRSGLPSNAIVTAVQLKFKVNTTSATIPGTITFFAVQEDWFELNVTYNNRPNVVSVDSNNITFANNTIYTETIDNFEDQLERILSFGLLLSVTTDGSTQVYSKESADSQKPELIVTYDLPLAVSPIITNPLDNQYVDRAKDLTVTWTTDQEQAEYELGYGTDGISWTTLSGTTAQSRTISGGTFAVGDLYFRIRYKPVGSSDWSDWSDSIFVNAVNNPLAPTSITSGSVTTATPTITATGTGVVQFTITIKNPSGSVFETATVVSASISYTVQKPLTDGLTYDVEITYKDFTGFDSDLGTSSITTAFVKPNTPTVTTSLGAHYINVEIANPAGGETVTHNNVYKIVDNTFQRVATNIPVNGTFIDIFVESGVEQVYFVRAYASGGGYAQSTDVRETLTFLDAYLITVDSSIGAELILAPERRKTIQNENTVFNFAGRKSSVVLYSGLANKNLDTFQYEVHDDATLKILEDMVEYKKTVCYRDVRGRKLFLALVGINVKDELPDYYTVSFKSIGVDFNEVV